MKYYEHILFFSVITQENNQKGFFTGTKYSLSFDCFLPIIKINKYPAQNKIQLPGLYSLNHFGLWQIKSSE